MRLKTIAAAAPAAVALAIAAPALAAPPLIVTLNIDVTSASGVSDFTPLTFQETWTFTPADTVNPGVLSSPLPGVIPATRHENESFSGSPAATSGSPFTANLMSLAGLSSLAGGVSHVEYGRNTIFNDANVQTSSNSDVEFFSSQSVNTLVSDNGTPGDPTDDTYLFQSYSQTIEGFGGAAQTPSGMTPATFAAYLAGLGPMSWSESASQSQGGEFFGGPPMVTLASVEYFGTATVTLSETGVPEPAAWALMILGLVGTGAALRRRKAVLAT